MSTFKHYKVTNLEQTPVLNEGTVSNSLDNLKIKILSLTSEEIVFDLIGVDASVANALRRILLAEVPTMAIEHIYIQQNTSIIQDEVLSHRLGLIPIKADPRLFDMIGEGDEATDLNTLVFKLDVSCSAADFTRNTPPTTTGPEAKHVYSRDFEWQPQGHQAERFPDGIAPVHGDILVAALTFGQQIQLEAHCVKGVGKDHAKFSPCATASYRLLPDIRFLKPVQGDRAVELKEMCPLRVFDIEDMGKGVQTAVAARPRDCTMCRECIRTKDWMEYVDLRRVSNHFIFSVETTGAMAPEVLVQEAIKVLRKKASALKGLISA